jgi:hypothetical protein
MLLRHDKDSLTELRIAGTRKLERRKQENNRGAMIACALAIRTKTAQWPLSAMQQRFPVLDHHDGWLSRIANHRNEKALAVRALSRAARSVLSYEASITPGLCGFRA